MTTTSVIDYDSDSSNECPFSAEISSKLSAAFAKATDIDIKFATRLLEEHQWNIDRALRAAYEAKEHAQSTNSIEKLLKIFSWNTDTTDSEDVELNDLIEQRTETIIEILLREKPDVILLQQVGTFSLTLIITCLSSFYDDESIQIDSPNNCNYISIFTRKSTMKKNHVSIIQNSDHWKMLKIEVEYKNSYKFDLFNAFIDENTASFCFEQIHQSKSDHIILSGISSQISDDIWNSHTIDLDDLWEQTGQQPEKIYTFDPELNSNIREKEKPQRYDRVFFQSSLLKAVYMKLEGIQRLKTSNHLFPSTHWAIQGYFDVN